MKTQQKVIHVILQQRNMQTNGHIYVYRYYNLQRLPKETKSVTLLLQAFDRKMGIFPLNKNYFKYKDHVV